LTTMHAESVRIDEVVALAEGSRQSGLTPETLKKHIDRGTLRGVWVGGRRMILRADFERFLRERRAARQR